MFVSIMAFHAKISDPTIGGTFMTLLNTITNLGSVWPTTLVLWLVDPLTMKQCDRDTTNTCSTPELSKVSTFSLHLRHNPTVVFPHKSWNFLNFINYRYFLKKEKKIAKNLLRWPFDQISYDPLRWLMLRQK